MQLCSPDLASPASLASPQLAARLLPAGQVTTPKSEIIMFGGHNKDIEWCALSMLQGFGRVHSNPVASTAWLARLHLSLANITPTHASHLPTPPSYPRLLQAAPL